MESIVGGLDACIAYYKLPYLPFKVPLRFESADLEQSFREFMRGQFLRERQTRVWFLFFHVHFVSIIIHAIAYRENLVSLAYWSGTPHNLMLGCYVLVNSVVTLMCWIASFASPIFSTDTRRLGFTMFVFLRISVLCNLTGLSPSVAEAVAGDNVLSFAGAISVLTAAILWRIHFIRCAHIWILPIFSVAPVIPLLFASPHAPRSWESRARLFIALALCTMVFAHGHIAMEVSWRRQFFMLHSLREMFVEERVKRYEAERRAEQPIVPSSEAAHGRAPSDCQQSRVSDLFDKLYKRREGHGDASAHLMADLKELGDAEHWLIKSEDLTLCSEDLTISSDRVLGAGGFGSVVVGTWMSARVAVKVPELRERGSHHPLALEMRHIRKLRHPCIVSFFGVCFDDVNSEVLLVEEYIEGDNLYKFVCRLGPLVGECLEFKQQVLADASAASEYLHSRNPAIVHGDFKPENILIDHRSLRAKLSDFGLARRFATKDKVPGCTRQWSEPRVRRSGEDEEQVTCSSDIWAFGALIFFLCTSVGPSNGKTLRSSPSMATFGASVFRLWRGEQSGDSFVIKANEDRLGDPRSICENFAFLQALC
eukprot:TRINITY_DN10714_c0_g1_i3.p1 TRINITY_DN10714_c0_g1~~TRINITY_DN10714_c0_g1_i3.p1  ORF type:complete len:595 (-),score=34.61 TRINITY_DN10714_c0_g1_i3:126-1910(-)